MSICLLAYQNIRGEASPPTPNRLNPIKQIDISFNVLAVTPEIELRLVGGSTNNEGRLEMRYNGEWGTICDDDWSNRNAKVACRQLGYKYAERSSRDFGAGNGTIWLDNVGCTGNESSLLDCNHGGLGVHNCDHAEDIGIICSSKLIV